MIRFTMFFRGRGPLWGFVLIWAAMCIVSLLLWSVNLPLFQAQYGDVTMSIVEFCAFIAFGSSGFMLAPRLENWEAVGSKKPRWLAAIVVVIIVLAGTYLLTTARIYVAVKWLNKFIPASREGFTPTDAWPIDHTIPTAALQPAINVLIIGCIVFVCIGLFGRAPGFFAALALWIFLALSTGFPEICAHSPYGVCLTFDASSEIDRSALLHKLIAVAIVCGVTTFIAWIIGAGSISLGLARIIENIRYKIGNKSTKSGVASGITSDIKNTAMNLETNNYNKSEPYQPRRANTV